MFVLLILAAVIWTAVIGWTERRFEWRPLVWVMAGTIAGLVINPYFPTNLQLFYEHLRDKDHGFGFFYRGRERMVPLRLVGVSRQLAGGLRRDGGRLYQLSILQTASERHHSLFFLIFATASDDYDCALETHCGILAAICGDVCRVRAATVAAGRALHTHQPADGHA